MWPKIHWNEPLLVSLLETSSLLNCALVSSDNLPGATSRVVSCPISSSDQHCYFDADDPSKVTLPLIATVLIQWQAPLPLFGFREKLCSIRYLLYHKHWSGTSC